MFSVAQRRDHHGLDGVDAVLGLVEDDRGSRLEDLVRHLHAVEAELLEDLLAHLRPAVVEGGKAVHELARRVPGLGHQRGVDLVGLQETDPLLPDRVGLAHRDPDVGVDEVAALDRGLRILGQRHLAAGGGGQLAGLRDEGLLGPEVLRRPEADVHPRHRPAQHQRVPHVVPGVAEKGEGLPVERLVRVLFHRQKVGQDLGRVELVGEAVPDRDAGVPGELLDDRLAESAVLDAVEHPPQDAGGVLHRLLLADLGSRGAEVGGVGALVVRRHLEGAAGPRRVLLEDQGDVLPAEPGLLGPGALGALQVPRQIEEVPDLGWREIVDREEMAAAEVDGHLLLSPARRGGGPDRQFYGRRGPESRGE